MNPNPIRSLELAARRQDAEDAKRYREILEAFCEGMTQDGGTSVFKAGAWTVTCHREKT